MTLAQAEFGKNYKVRKIDVDDEELKAFLFTLGCYSGEDITLVSSVSGSYVISIKDARYNVDLNLAEAILVE